MTYNNRPGTLDGPPKSRPSLPAKIVGSFCVAIPIVLILVAMVWAVAWLIVNFPS